VEAILAPFINDMTSFKIQKLQWGLLSHKYMTQMLYPCGQSLSSVAEWILFIGFKKL
jgi:hypothetical protein